MGKKVLKLNPDTLDPGLTRNVARKCAASLRCMQSVYMPTSNGRSLPDRAKKASTRDGYVSKYEQHAGDTNADADADGDVNDESTSLPEPREDDEDEQFIKMRE